MKKVIASLLALSVLLVALTPIPLTAAFSQISVYTDKAVYAADDSVYIYGTVVTPLTPFERVNVTVAAPSGGVWSSILLLPDSLGNFGATVGIISTLDSTGTYLVSVKYLNFVNSTTFQVKTPQTLTVKTDKTVYLVNETITVSGQVSPLIQGYRVTLRVGLGGTSWSAVAQTTPTSDGSYVFKDFYKVRSIDNGKWVLNVTYGPFASSAVSLYVGVRVNLFLGKTEYLPGQRVNVTGYVSPLISGPVTVYLKNPSGVLWVDPEVVPDSTGKFTVMQMVYPGDQVGNYSVSASYWGVTNRTSFLVGRLGVLAMSVSSLGVYNVSDNFVSQISAGSLVRVKATLNNLDKVTHKFVFITQIKDSSGKIVFIGSQSSSVKPGSIIGQVVGTTLQVKDTYTVEVFIWDSWVDANTLSEVYTVKFKIV